MGVLDEIRAPDLISISNILVGFAGIWLSITDIYYGCSAIIVSAILDGVDGLVAKWEKSLLGREMDSLADVVSFGVLPGLILVLYSPSTLSLSAAGFIVATGMLRLARFNILKRDYFEGIPITYTGLAISLLVLSDFPDLVIIVIAFILSALMVSPIRYEKIKNRTILITLAVFLILSLISGIYRTKSLIFASYLVLILLLLYAISPIRGFMKNEG